MTTPQSPQIQLPPGWLLVLQEQFSMPYMQQLKAFLVQRKKQGAIIFPPSSQWFNALNLTDFNDVKVVILGQDPYHGAGQAHGLSFSVQSPTLPPPSLNNIFKELQNDLELPLNAPKQNTDLSRWAKQGVLLLNSVLTVEQSQPASHANQGWEKFTDEIIHLLNQKREHLVFILWGSYAQKKGNLIDPKRHLIIRSAHPSPLSSHRGFFGSKPFSRTNHYLSQHQQTIIDWTV
jgi:uracil-DNA glycosylase